MSRFRVVYSRGSFGFVSLCDTHEAAMAEARALQRMPGVWHVHIEDVHGMRIAGDFDLRVGDGRDGRFPALAALSSAV
jgi:hypothetical protein